MTDISYIKKITTNEVQRWGKIRSLLNVENDRVKLYYRQISLFDNDRKKNLLDYLNI